MWLYITAEDVFGEARPERKGPQPPSTIPTTLSGLFDVGMRHHRRSAALTWSGTGGAFESCPDWRLDRLAIRVALFCRERLGVTPGERVVIFGKLGWLWPVTDFAATGLGATSVGIEHDVREEALLGALEEANPRAIFASDPESGARLLALRAAGRLPRATVAGEDLGAEGDDVVPLARLLALGGNLDTPERAQVFRVASRKVMPEETALWHSDSASTQRLTHAHAVGRIAARLRTDPARGDEVAYLEAPRVTLGTRLALFRFVGNGVTVTALGREGRTSEDLALLRPHEIHVGVRWLERVCEGAGPRWPFGAGRAARTRLRATLGDRVRVVEAESRPGEAAARTLAAAGLSLSIGEGGSESH